VLVGSCDLDGEAPPLLLGSTSTDDLVLHVNTDDMFPPNLRRRQPWQSACRCSPLPFPAPPPSFLFLFLFSSTAVEPPPLSLVLPSLILSAASPLSPNYSVPRQIDLDFGGSYFFSTGGTAASQQGERGGTGVLLLLLPLPRLLVRETSQSLLLALSFSLPPFPHRYPTSSRSRSV
jgi:hypothetical protein